MSRQYIMDVLMKPFLRNGGNFKWQIISLAEIKSSGAENDASFTHGLDSRWSATRATNFYLGVVIPLKYLSLASVAREETRCRVWTAQQNDDDDDEKNQFGLMNEETNRFDNTDSYISSAALVNAHSTEKCWHRIYSLLTAKSRGDAREWSANRTVECLSIIRTKRLAPQSMTDRRRRRRRRRLH